MPTRARAGDGNCFEMAGAALGGAELVSPRRDLALGALETRFREPHRTRFTSTYRKLQLGAGGLGAQVRFPPRPPGM